MQLHIAIRPHEAFNLINRTRPVQDVMATSQFCAACRNIIAGGSNEPAEAILSTNLYFRTRTTNEHSAQRKECPGNMLTPWHYAGNYPVQTSLRYHNNHI